MPRRDVAGACFQLVVQALHQLILGSGSDCLHASFIYTQFELYGEGKCSSSSAYMMYGREE